MGHHRLIKKHRQSARPSSEYLMNWFEELGPIFKLMFTGGLYQVYIADPSAVEKLFRNEGIFPRRNHRIEDMFEWFFRSRKDKCTFAFETGEKWRLGRSKLNKQSKLANAFSYCSGFNRVSDRLIRNILHEQDDNGCVEDIKTLLMYWTLDAAAYFVIGADMDSFNDKQGYPNRLKEAVDQFSSSISSFSTALPLYRLCNTFSHQQLSSSFNVMHDISRMYVIQQLKDIRRSPPPTKEQGISLLEQWLHDESFSEDEAVRNAISLLAAGLDITTNTTELILYELSKHSHVQDKLYRQVLSVLGTEGEANGDSLQRMPYLNHVIKEGQRLHPVSPIRTRTLDKDIEMLGYDIPAGTPILASQFAIGHNEKFFKDPLIYNPDRWSTDVIHPFAQLPFGFGPKNCWGRRFAEVQIKVMLTKVCRRFMMESVESKSSAVGSFVEHTLVSRSVPTKIRFIPRKQ